MALIRKGGHYVASYLDAFGRRHQRVFYAIPKGMDFQARKELTREGFQVTDVVWREPNLLASVFDKFTREEQVDFLESVLNQVELGDTPGEALKIAVESLDGATRSRFEPCLEVLRRGSASQSGTLFCDALEQSNAFTRQTLALLRSSERTGKLAEGLKEAMEYLEDHGKVWSSLTAPLGTLAMESSTALSLVGYLKHQYLPGLVNEKTGSKTPEQLAVWQDLLTATITRVDWIYYGTIGAMVVVVVVAGAYAFGGRAVQRSLIEAATGIPLVRQLLLDNAFALSFSVAGRMTRGRAKRSEALAMAQDVAGVPAVERFWGGLLKKVSAGVEFADALKEGGLLTRGEASKLKTRLDPDQLARVLIKSGQHRTKQITKTAKRLVKVSWLAFALYMGGVGAVAYQVMSTKSEGVMQDIRTQMDI